MMMTDYLYRLLVVDVAAALSLCRDAGGGLDVVDEPRHAPRPPGPAVGQSLLTGGEMEVLERVLISDLVVRLHRSPQVVVALNGRGGRTQGHR